jgi:hypothetical protein
MLKSKGRVAAAGTAIAVATSATAVLLLGGGSATAGTTAVAPANTVTGTSVVDGSLNQVDINPNVVAKVFRVPGKDSVTGSWSVKDGSIAEADLSQGVKDKLNKVGAPGKGGTDALLSVTKLINLSNRNDTATDGSVWAKDNLMRTLSVTRQHAAEADKCGAGAVKCWFYSGTIGDNGTFTTVDGAVSPNANKPINGTVNGSVVGVAEVEFYASSDTPDPMKVDATIAGSTSTGDMVKLFFAGTTTKFSTVKMTDYRWTYAATAPNTCETHTQAMVGGNTGDITGVNACK